MRVLRSRTTVGLYMGRWMAVENEGRKPVLEERLAAQKAAGRIP